MLATVAHCRRGLGNRPRFPSGGAGGSAALHNTHTFQAGRVQPLSGEVERGGANAAGGHLAPRIEAGLGGWRHPAAENLLLTKVVAQTESFLGLVPLKASVYTVLQIHVAILFLWNPQTGGRQGWRWKTILTFVELPMRFT